MRYSVEMVRSWLEAGREEEETRALEIPDVPEGVWTNLAIVAERRDMDPVELATLILADGAYALAEDYLSSEDGEAELAQALRERETG